MLEAGGSSGFDWRQEVERRTSEEFLDQLNDIMGDIDGIMEDIQEEYEDWKEEYPEYVKEGLKICMVISPN